MTDPLPQLCTTGQQARALARYTGGAVTQQMVLCGNDRGFNDMWSLYNQLWSEALSYFSHPLLQMVYVQQAPMFKASQHSYDTWQYFWQRQVLPVLARQPCTPEHVPKHYYRWWITRDMPYILDRDLPPGYNVIAGDWRAYVRCSFAAYALRQALEHHGVRV